ncbi:hypothetical protein H0E87_005261 [Populus deltoides]|uniref:UspA domain-containing protein n=1 Tax=Populus deltoides TaxID=3696 RepID=A0A8T2ZI80_POPDE|nr:hypothetical protein H0E87_005261 [Populus deltoides]
MEGVSVDDKHKIVVAVDESEESMHALSWCLSNLISHNSTTTLVLLYVKPRPIIYSSFDIAEHIFSADVIVAMEKYGTDLVNSVMKRAEAVFRNFNRNVNQAFSFCMLVCLLPSLHVCLMMEALCR